ncbi:SWI/SNF and RSC complexes subunit arp42 [Schizosaccharomyces pombe]
MANDHTLEEIPSLVIDPGSCWTRFGYAGEESPMTILPSYYGVRSDVTGRNKYVVDELQIHAPIPGMEVKNGKSNGIIQDWESTLYTWERGLKEKLQVNPTEYAMMITEPSWNPQSVRQQIMEAAFEQLHVPAFYLTKQAVCVAFANSKSTALIVDIGSDNASVTPVVDGLIIRKGIFKQSLAGDFLNANIEQLFNTMNIEFPPHYRIARKSVAIQQSGNMANGSADAVKPAVLYPPIQDLTSSYEIFQKRRVIEEWKESVLDVLDTPFDEAKASSRNPKPFEFPDGVTHKFGQERFRISEILFNPSFSASRSAETTPPQGSVGLHELVYQSILACDSELRSPLLNNIVVTGGTSLIPGLSERLQAEVQRLATGSRINVHTAETASATSNAVWFGGSILASLDNFQHLWVSKQEYDEVGVDRALFVEKRCK